MTIGKGYRRSGCTRQTGHRRSISAVPELPICHVVSRSGDKWPAPDMRLSAEGQSLGRCRHRRESFQIDPLRRPCHCCGVAGSRNIAVPCDSPQRTQGQDRQVAPRVYCSNASSYCMALTRSIQSTAFPSIASVIAMCAMVEEAVAPCQCLVLGGIAWGLLTKHLRVARARLNNSRNIHEMRS